MKPICTLLISAALLVTPILAKGGKSHTGKTHVKGYTKKDGKHVEPHVRTAPNKTAKDNYSSKGNVNPATGKEGTKEPKK